MHGEAPHLRVERRAVPDVLSLMRIDDWGHGAVGKGQVVRGAVPKQGANGVSVWEGYGILGDVVRAEQTGKRRVLTEHGGLII